MQQISMPFLEHFFAEFISWPCDQVPLFSSHAVTKGPVLMLKHNESDTTSAKINQEVIIYYGCHACDLYDKNVDWQVRQVLERNRYDEFIPVKATKAYGVMEIKL